MALTLTELSRLLDTPEPRNDDGQTYLGVSSLQDATPQDISFLGNDRYLAQLKTTSAGIVLIPKKLSDPPKNLTTLAVENPSLEFAKVISHFQKSRTPFTPGIHPKAHVAQNVTLDPEKVCIKAGAIIEEGCTIGHGTEIGCGAVIGQNVTIGQDCLLHANTSVRENCKLGNRVTLQPGAVIGSDGYGYELSGGQHLKIPQVGNVILEDDVEIGANSCIDRARFGTTTIGQGTKVDNLVQIGHNASTGKGCLIISQSGVAGSAKLGDYVTMAAQSGVAGHIEIGNQVILAGRAGATKSISEPGPYMGFPARPMKTEQKKLAALARLPKLIKEIKNLLPDKK